MKSTSNLPYPNVPFELLTRFTLLLVCPAAIAAQTATFAGAVVRDTLEHGISGARITLVGAGRSDTSDAKGEFKFTNLAAGKIAVMIRHVGFQPMVDSVDLVNGQRVEREYVMDIVPVQLDSMRVTAAPHLTATMREFEDHMKTGTDLGTGHFLTGEYLTKNDARGLQDVISSAVPNLRVYRPDPLKEPTKDWLSSGRGGCNGPVFQCKGQDACPITLYVDGFLRLNPHFDSDPKDWPDFNTFLTADYAGVEYYAGGASIPQEYNATSNSCGVLVLWQRQQVRKPN